jgi:hypothetical protein
MSESHSDVRYIQDIPKVCIHIIIRNINLVYTSFGTLCTKNVSPKYMKTRYKRYFLSSLLIQLLIGSC